MTVGNVVNTGFKLYTSNFKPYLKVAAIATLWALLPWLVLLPLIAFFATVQDYYSTLGLLIPAWLVLLILCSTRYLAGAAAIARLAFGELTQQPETPQQAQRFTHSRKWGFLILTIIVGLIFLGVTLAMYILAAIFIVAIFAIMGGVDFLRNPASAALVNPTLIVTSGLIVLMVIVVFTLIMAWFSVRFSVADLSLAIEPGIGASQSIGRSWELTRKGVWRIFLILMVTGIITIPVQVLVQIVMGLVQEATTLLFPPSSTNFVVFTTALSVVLALLSGIFLLPLWQSMKAVIYYDLRTRREGLDLELRDWGDRTPPTDA
jgi:hypothetical protein